MIMECVKFFIDELLWMMTWGSYQLILGVIFTWFLFILMGRMHIMQAFVLAIGSYAFAVVTYFAFVWCICVNILQWEFIAGGVPAVSNVFDASLYLGGILSVVQGCFYLIINYWRPFFVIHFFMLSLVANIIAAFCASLLVRVTF